jgi:hypothetical protein
MNDLKKICISSFVYGDYADYIPVYIFSILKAYPEYEVKIFLHDELTTNVGSALDFIKDNLSNRFIIVENYYKSRVPHKYLRWVIPHRDFKEYDYVFINDVDFIILREKPSLLEFYQSHLNKFSLPFGNFIRKNIQDQPKRLSGSHFIKVNDYYKKTESIIKEVLCDPFFDITKSNIRYHSRGEIVYSDENLLYEIVRKSFNFNEANYTESKNSFAHHHGIHLGLMNRKNLDIDNLGNNSKYFENKMLIRNYLQDEIFIQLLGFVKSEKIKSEINMLYQIFGIKKIFTKKIFKIW